MNPKIVEEFSGKSCKIFIIADGHSLVFSTQELFFNEQQMSIEFVDKFGDALSFPIEFITKIEATK